MKRILGFMLVLTLSVSLFAGCAKTEEPVEVTGTETEATETEATETEATETEATETEAADAVTTASIVNDSAALVAGLSAEGTWIVATLNNLVVEEEIIVEGEFHNKNDAAQDIYRKLGLYTQDADRNIIDSFTLTAPKMTVRSENFKIHGGTFIGDVYVEAKGFSISKGSVDGNVYYSSQEIMDSAVIDEESTVTGTQEVK